MINISGLFFYPAKGMGGTALGSAEVQQRGLAGDRRWMAVDAAGRFLSQRSLPRLALLRVEAEPEGLLLRAPGRPDLSVRRPRGGVSSRVAIWRDTVDALPADAAAHRWLSDYLGEPCRLVYMPEESIRPVDPAYGTDGDHVSFADGYPILLTNEASLAELNRRMGDPLPMDRFRPNLVVTGADAFAEDTWREIRVGAVRMQVVKPCGRCTVTTTDQQTAARGKEPLRTLATFRRVESKVYFGVNLIPSELGNIRSGDPVAVLRTGRGLFQR
jgi:uncharacterized protein YcbX